MRVKEKVIIPALEGKKEELLEGFRVANKEYFQENPRYRPYLSYGEDCDGNATRPYIGVEDEDGNAICAGIDEHLNLMNKRYLVIVDDGAHDGFIQEVDIANIWHSGNPDGWNYQDHCGAHGRVLDECENEGKADRVLGNYLDCPSAKEGRYCYTHNPNPER